jgi:phosphoribosyl-AMP cyclohydrolase / phosphoribosyl-ATP pyrophosphohydrolase
MTEEVIKKLKFDQNGLIPAIAQDEKTGEVLMMAFMNEESLKLTISSGFATYYSRSRKSLWKKGDTSGHFQEVVSLTTDCDFDCILMKVKQTGVACHTGKMSCFFNKI